MVYINAWKASGGRNLASSNQRPSQCGLLTLMMSSEGRTHAFVTFCSVFSAYGSHLPRLQESLCSKRLARQFNLVALYGSKPRSLTLREEQIEDFGERVL